MSVGEGILSHRVSLSLSLCLPLSPCQKSFHVLPSLSLSVEQSEKPPKLPMSDDNIMRILDICTQKMAVLYDTIRGKESTEVPYCRVTNVDRSPSTSLSISLYLSIIYLSPHPSLHQGELPLPPTTITQAVLPSHNVRVKLQQAQFEADDYDGLLFCGFDSLLIYLARHYFPELTCSSLMLLPPHSHIYTYIQMTTMMMRTRSLIVKR